MSEYEHPNMPLKEPNIPQDEALPVETSAVEPVSLQPCKDMMHSERVRIMT